jgi:D-beta-D-heptose 7-phosphate kinase/D-beta-D-heptose 1-phosphate adenosyltransferase
VIEKGWGYEIWIHNDSDYCGKILVVYKDLKCSLHHHPKKRETFYLITGCVHIRTVINNVESEFLMNPGDVLELERGDDHQFTGVSIVSQIVEISTQHFDEDSIRIEKGEKMKTVFTNGIFDVVHFGHTNSLREASELGYLIVGLNTDESTRRIKGEGSPIFNLEQRKAVLESIKYVDRIIPFDDDTPERLIHEIKPDILVKGMDYEIKDIVGARFVKSYGGSIYRTPTLCSSTYVMNKMVELDRRKEERRKE